MTEGAPRAGRLYSGKQSRSRGGVTRCAEASASSGEGCGTPGAKTQTRGGAKSARRRVGTTDRCAATPASTNSLQREINQGKKSAGMVPYLVTMLREAWSGAWSSRWSARWARITDELGQRRQLCAREAGSG
jgi:hypothetical protein